MVGIPEHPGYLFCIVCTELRRTSCTQGTGIETMEGFMCLIKCNSGYFMMPFLNSSCCSGRVEVCYGCPLFSACPARTSLLTQETWIPLNPFAASTCAGGWRERGHFQKGKAYFGSPGAWYRIYNPGLTDQLWQEEDLHSAVRKCSRSQQWWRAWCQRNVCGHPWLTDPRG